MTGPRTPPPYRRGDVIRTAALSGGRRARWLVLKAWGRRGRRPEEPWSVSLTDVTPKGGAGKGDITRYASQLTVDGAEPDVVAHYDFDTMTYTKL